MGRSFHIVVDPELSERASFPGHEESRLLGRPAEILAALDSIHGDLEGRLPVQAVIDTAPGRNAQVEVIEKDVAGATVATTHGADGGGEVLPGSAGHEDLIDAVRIAPFEPVAAGDLIRTTSRASLTSAVPGG